MKWSPTLIKNICLAILTQRLKWWNTKINGGITKYYNSKRSSALNSVQCGWVFQNTKTQFSHRQYKYYKYDEWGNRRVVRLSSHLEGKNLSGGGFIYRAPIPRRPPHGYVTGVAHASADIAQWWTGWKGQVVSQYICSSLLEKELFCVQLFREYSVEKWKKCCEHVKKIGDEYLKNDHIEKIIIREDSGSQSSSDSYSSEEF